jgi:HCOMODA/2-hydroxy-3-carboxy-muconic semialdehyde decarboxylase
MATLSDVRRDLVAANRILANEGILDVYGHVSARHPEHPDRYLLARARSPELIEEDDLIEFTLDSGPLPDNPPPLYLERFIHGAVYQARPEIMAVCHNHTTAIVPFSISRTTKLQAVFHSAGFLPREARVWDIAEEFGTSTDLLVRNLDHGRSLARRMGDDPLVLMRGHGSAVAGRTVEEMVNRCIQMEKNARIQLMAMQLGEFIPLYPGEGSNRGAPSDDRAWEYYKRRAGV